MEMGPFSPTLEKARSDQNDTTVWVQFHLVYTIVKLLTKVWFCVGIFQACPSSFLQKDVSSPTSSTTAKRCVAERSMAESEIAGPTGRQELCCTNVAMRLLWQTEFV